MASDSELIGQVSKSAEKLAVASTWNGHLALDPPNDFVFELYVLFRMLVDLQTNYSIEFVPGVKKATFPRKPAPKKGWPKFVLKKDGKRIAQICAGTQIQDLNGSLTAPDISVQAPDSPESPTFHHVMQILDAKHKSKVSKRITSPEFSEFQRWVELFNLRSKLGAMLKFDQLTVMAGNCLITNGNHSTEPNAERIRVNVKEVYGFSPKSTAKLKPE